MKTIGINVLFLVPNQVGGTEYLTREFVTAFESDQTHRYILFCNTENFDSFHISSKHIQKVLCNVQGTDRKARLVYEQCVLPFVVRQHHCDILHSFGYTAPLWGFCPQIVTVHDANWLDHPQDFPFASRTMTNILVRGAVAKARAVITDSTFANARLQCHFPSATEKIHTVLPVISDDIAKPPFAELPTELKGKRFALCVSAFYPHKNIPYLLELWTQVNAIDSDAVLVLVGHNGRDELKVEQEVAKRKNILHLQKVSFALLKNLYASCALFIHPSTYEGFGLPVYEAYATGNQVLVGKTNLYEDGVSESLLPLHFDVEKDAFLVCEKIQSAYKKKRRSLWKATESLRSLLDVYEKIC